MRRIVALLSMMGLAVLLVACGGGDDDADPTSETVPTVASTATSVAPTLAPTEDQASPVASPVTSSPVASPVALLVATPMATPIGSPVLAIAASPVASPAASPAASPVTETVPVAGIEDDMSTRVLTGTVMLPGTENERYVISADGCVGLGRYAGVHAGQQVVIKNEAGTITGVTTLAATDSQTACSWTFEAEVPVASYYTVSLPLIAEIVVSDGDLDRLNGDVQISLP